MPNIAKICQSVVKILRFFEMAASAILDFQICEILLADGLSTAQRHHCAKCRQNWSFSCGYCIFSNFRDGRRHLRFLKSRHFIVYQGPKGRDELAR